MKRTLRPDVITYNGMIAAAVTVEKALELLTVSNSLLILIVALCVQS